MKEKPYQFKEELLEIHKKNCRNFSLTPSDDEFVLDDGILLVVGQNADEVIITAARDFEDYLFTSMNVSATVTPKIFGNASAITMRLSGDLGNAQGYMGYRITVTKAGIEIEGADEKGIAQALYHLEDVMNIRKAPFVEVGVTERKAVFSRRKAQPPFGMNEYIDEGFAHMAHLGIDTLPIGMNDAYTTSSNERIDLNLLCKRAKKYGIDIIVELSCPHEKTADAYGAQEYYDNMYGALFKVCPELAGVIIVGESTNQPSKDPNAPKPYLLSLKERENIPPIKPPPGSWPCFDYPEWLELIRNAVRKHSQKAEIIFSTYNWGFAPEEDRLKVIERLPEGITIEPTWDMFHQYRVGDSIETVVDYSLSFTGPGKYFTSEAIAAKKRDIKLYTNSQTLGRTWDFGVIPYEPMPGMWSKRYEAMLKANKDWNLTGITETIHYGFYPSIIAELEKEMFFTGGKSPEEIIDALITRDYGENAPKVKEAMSLFDKAITHYVPTNEDQYGAFRIGPSYPFWIENSFNKGKRPDEMKSHFGSRLYYAEYTPLDVNFHHEKGSSLVGVRIFDEIKSNEKMRNLFARGIAVLKSCSNMDNELQKLIALAQFMHNTTQTVINNKNFFILKQKLNIAGTKEAAAKILDEMEALLREERKNAEDTITVVNTDSRLGWEPSMEYTTDEKALRWKIRQLDYSLDYVLPNFRNHNNYIDKF